MAAEKSSKYPHRWPDGSYHSVPWSQTKRAQATGTPNPSPGSYDPALDSELGKSQRGLGDLLSDIGTGVDGQPLGLQRTRAQDDLATGLAKIDQSSGRSLSDLLTARTQEGQDYTTNIAGVQRGFQNLGTAQAEAQRKSGTYLGGAVQQAADKRAANEALARAPIDTAHQRYGDQSTETEKRLTQDTGTARDELGLGFTRQNTDWNTQLTRGQREQNYFAADTLDAKVAQFLQNNPGAKVPITPGPFSGTTTKVPVTSIAAGPGIPGTTTRKRKTKAGLVTTYGNRVTGP
jgi:hypothetical protein